MHAHTYSAASLGQPGAAPRTGSAHVRYNQAVVSQGLAKGGSQGSRWKPPAVCLHNLDRQEPSKTVKHRSPYCQEPPELSKSVPPKPLTPVLTNSQHRIARYKVYA